MDIVDKITGDIYLATEFTSFKNESQNAIVSTGQTLSASSDVQLAKALTIAGQTANSYQDSGSANAYALTRTGSLEQPNSYIDGMRISFVTANANTGASTVNVSGLGVKAIVKAGDIALSAGDISENTYMELIYDPAADSASGGFVLLHAPFKISYFTSSGTYNKPSGLKYAEVEAQAAGGGGGGAGGGGGGAGGGGGGGGGAYTAKLFLSSEIGATETVTIGAGGLGGDDTGANGGNGGNTSFGALLVCNGGTGGFGDGSRQSTVGRGSLGGAGGSIATTGNDNESGQLGGTGSLFNTTAVSGKGGNSRLGSGGSGTAEGVGSANGTGYGSGGGGGATVTTSGQAGGNGADGFIIIKEYF